MNIPECLATQDIRDLVSSQFGLSARSRGDHSRDLPIHLVGHASVPLTRVRDLAGSLRLTLSTEHALCYEVYGAAGIVPGPLIPQSGTSI